VWSIRSEIAGVLQETRSVSARRDRQRGSRSEQRIRLALVVAVVEWLDATALRSEDGG
jgi:hypothetical protein